MIVRLMGGLGNQMFQYAFGKSFSIKTDADLILDLSYFDQINSDTKRHYQLNLFNIDVDTVNIKSKPSNALSRILGKFTAPLPVVNEPQTNKYWPEVYKQNPNALYVGFWQTEKYFANIRNLLLQDFKPKGPCSENYTNLTNTVSGSQSVSVHIRRGDYVQNKVTNEYHGTCDLTYYEDAVNNITSRVKNPTYFIFTDDVAWTKKNFLTLQNSRIVSEEGLDDLQEMQIMAKCKNNIIANSSFSWWGAWLNDNPSKIVIAPKRWFSKAELNDNDIVCDSWETV